MYTYISIAFKTYIKTRKWIFLQNTPKRLTLLTSVKLFAQANRAACVKRVKDVKHECKGQKKY